MKSRNGILVGLLYNSNNNRPLIEFVGERRNNVLRRKIENQTERYRNRQRRQRPLQHGQQDEREAETLDVEPDTTVITNHKNGHIAGERRCPITKRCRFANENTVEDEIAQSQLDAVVLVFFFNGDCRWS